MNFVERLHANWKRFGFNGRIDQIRHGDLSRWLEVLKDLPQIQNVRFRCGEVVHTSSPEKLACSDRAILDHAVRALIPWRKGPFSFFDIEIDAEWRSDYKWSRLAKHVDLKSKRVLDVGSGNGYFGYRMLEAGAKSVTGLDSSILAVMQNALINHYASQENVVLPLRFETGSWIQDYDIVFSMGVLYHQRDHDSHLRELQRSLRVGGTLVLESIVAENPLYPTDRYARMRNVWCIPSVSTITQALAKLGFTNRRVVSVSATTSKEQRRTKYMPFESLADALSATDPSVTVEGHPAPQRAIILAENTRKLT